MTDTITKTESKQDTLTSDEI
ncbi:hypothetical protein MNBD_GAMMA03-917, partial [hydrothermal vent metagenome]